MRIRSHFCDTEVYHSPSYEHGSAAFRLVTVGSDPDQVRNALNEIVAMLTVGREVYWRYRPEEPKYNKDFESELCWWQARARFSVRSIGTIEHEPPPDERIFSFGVK